MAANDRAADEDRYGSLDRFEVLNFLGGGAFGKVYKARHKESGELCVIKEIVLSDHARRTEDKHIKQCLEEAQFLMKNQHPYIIGFRGQFSINGTLRQSIGEKGQGLGWSGSLNESVKGMTAICIVMEFAPKGDLDAVIKGGSHISTRRIWSYFINLLLGIGHLHANKVIHRDIKPANVLIDDMGRLKIGDLGLGRDISDRSNGCVNTVKGTFYYMCPEMLHGKPYDGRCDMWSLGVVLYEMMKLVRPFTGNTEFELMKQIVRDEPPDTEFIQNRYGWNLYKLTRWLLQKYPPDRPTALEVWSYLLRERWIPAGVSYDPNAVPWTDEEIASANKDCQTLHSIGFSPNEVDMKREFDEGKRKDCYSIFLSGTATIRYLTAEEVAEHERASEGRKVTGPSRLACSGAGDGPPSKGSADIRWPLKSSRSGQSTARPIPPSDLAGVAPDDVPTALHYQKTPSGGPALDLGISDSAPKVESAAGQWKSITSELSGAPTTTPPSSPHKGQHPGRSISQCSVRPPEGPDQASPIRHRSKVRPQG